MELPKPVEDTMTQVQCGAALGTVASASPLNH